MTILFTAPFLFSLLFPNPPSPDKSPEKSVLQHKGKIIGGYGGKQRDRQTEGVAEYERGERYPGRSLR